MFADTLKALRISRKISQKDFARALKVSQQNVASWEVGRTEPSNMALKNIAEYFNVTTDYLLGHEGAAVTLSKTQAKFLKLFDKLNVEGQALIMGMLNSLGITHAKEKMSVVQKNTGGTNILSTGGHNSYNIVTP